MLEDAFFSCDMYSRRVTFPCSNSWTKKEMEKYSGSLFVLRKAEPRGMVRWWKGCLLDIWFCRIYKPFHLNWLPEILITTYLHFSFIICLFRQSVALCIILFPCNATTWFNFLGCPYVVIFICHAFANTLRMWFQNTAQVLFLKGGCFKDLKQLLLGYEKKEASFQNFVFHWTVLTNGYCTVIILIVKFI